MIDLKILLLKTRTFRNGWTEEKANQTCFKLIKDKIPTDLEENGIIVSKEEYIESCIEDIKVILSIYCVF